MAYVSLMMEEVKSSADSDSATLVFIYLLAIMADLYI